MREAAGRTERSRKRKGERERERGGCRLGNSLCNCQGEALTSNPCSTMLQLSICRICCRSTNWLKQAPRTGMANPMRWRTLAASHGPCPSPPPPASPNLPSCCSFAASAEQQLRKFGEAGGGGGGAAAEDLPPPAPRAAGEQVHKKQRGAGSWSSHRSLGPSAGRLEAALPLVPFVALAPLTLIPGTLVALKKPSQLVS